MKANSITSHSSEVSHSRIIVLKRIKQAVSDLFLVFLTTVSIAYSLTVQAQTTSYDTALKEFEGFYQLPNKVAYLEIKLQGDNLLARQVWDKREYLLMRKSDLEFESKAEEYRCVFSKDVSGRIVYFKAMNRIIMTKVSFNPNQEAVLAPDKLRILEGKYQFSKDKKMLIELRAKDNSLLLEQQWDGKVIIFNPLSETNFYNKEMRFPLTFVKQGGVVRQLICFEDHLWDKIE